MLVFICKDKLWDAHSMGSIKTNSPRHNHKVVLVDMAGREVNIRIYFSEHGWTFNKQELEGEESCSTDFKRRALAAGKR
jgi:predicted phosphatase